MTGSDIKVAVFDSRIEITSPGGLPKGITIEDVLGWRSEIRNKVIVRIFREANIVEQWGRGVQRIIQLCENKGLKKPDIIESGMFVKFILYRKSDAKSDAKSNETVYIQKILSCLQENKTINISQAMQVLNLSKSRTNDILKSMVKNDILEKQGLSRATKYILKQ